MDSVAAQHGIAVDRFARVIVGFLKVAGGALAAPECPSRWAMPIKPILHERLSVCYTAVRNPINERTTGQKRSTTMMHRLFVAIVLALALGACGSAPAMSVSTQPTLLPTALPTAVPVPTTMPSSTLQTPQDVGAQIDSLLQKLSQ